MAEFTAKKIDAILRDKYHNNMTTTDIRKKHGISQKVWNEINKKFGELFVKRHGKRSPDKVKISVDDLTEFWSGGRDKQPYQEKQQYSEQEYSDMYHTGY